MARATILACLSVLLWLGAPVGVDARPTQSTLTPADYRRHCLLCHKAAPPEGVAPEIVAGLGVGHGRSAAELMPNTLCWRRCEKCWTQPGDAKAKGKRGSTR